MCYASYYLLYIYNLAYLYHPDNSTESLFTPVPPVYSGCSSYSETILLSDSYSLAPNHQFFDNDFRVLQNSPSGAISCPFSGAAPHRLSRGPPVDGCRAPLRHRLPLLAAGFAGVPADCDSDGAAAAEGTVGGPVGEGAVDGGPVCEGAVCGGRGWHGGSEALDKLVSL